MAKGKGSGWHGESVRHKLAASGISMRANAVFRPYRPVGRIDYNDSEQWIFAFWKASIENDWDEFDFNKVFEIGKREIVDWVDLNAEMVDIWFVEEYARDNEIPETTDYDIIVDMMIDDGWFYPDWSWDEVYEELCNPPKELAKKIILVDKLIHLQHGTGNVLRDKEGAHIEDMNFLRAKFDRIYGSPMG